MESTEVIVRIKDADTRWYKDCSHVVETDKTLEFFAFDGMATHQMVIPLDTIDKYRVVRRDMDTREEIL